MGNTIFINDNTKHSGNRKSKNEYMNSQIAILSFSTQSIIFTLTFKGTNH